MIRRWTRTSVERTLRELSRKCANNLAIAKADKGNSIVILPKAQYMEKMGNILSDSSKFKQIEEDDTLSNQEKFKNFLRSHKDEFGWSDKEYKDIYPTAAATPKLYGLPKIHK